MSNSVSTFLGAGGGFDYEDHIGAFYLSILLNKGIPEGLMNAEMKKISFQQANQDNPLDDFVIEADHIGQKVKLSLQAKRDISFGTGEEFSNVIKACFSQLKSPEFNELYDKFGIVVGVFTRNIDKHYKGIYKLANDSSDEKEFTALINNQADPVKSFYNDIKEILKESLENEELELWMFFKSFVIIYLEYSEPSKTQNVAINNIKNILSDVQQSNIAYEIFLNITRSTRVSGGSITYETLCSKLINAGIYLKSFENSKELSDYKKILSFNKKVLSDVKSDINGTIADRTSIIQDIKQELGTVELFKIIGTEGTGKSAILKSIIQEYTENVNLLVFSDKRFNDIKEGGWQGYANYNHIETPLNSLLYSLISNGKDVYIFIDGVDFINSDSERRIILDVIKELKLIQSDTKFEYKLVVTGRNNLNIKWLENELSSKKISEKTISFNLEEHADFLEKLNIDKSFYIVEKNRLNPLFSNLFILEVFSNIENKQILNSEWGIAKLWWNDYIKTPEIKLCLLELGNSLICLPNKKHCSTTAMKILDSLVANSILIKDDYENYYTRHDIYRDWLLSFVLEIKYEEGIEHFISFIKTLDESNSNFYLKPFELLCSKFLLSKNYDIWLDLYNNNLEKVGAIWKQGLIESVFNIATDEEILFDFLNSISVNEKLFADILKYLYNTKRILKESDLSIDYFAWNPFVKWLSVNAKNVNLYEEIYNIFILWKYYLLFQGNFYFSDIADIYNYWLKEAEKGQRWRLGYKRDNILRELIFLAIYKPEYIKAELSKKYERRDNRDVDVFLSYMPMQILIEKFPLEYSEFILKNTTFSIEELEKMREEEHFYSSIDEDDIYLMREYSLFFACLHALSIFSKNQ